MQHNFGLMEVSAKLGHGIKEAFSRLITEVYRSMEMEGLTYESTRGGPDRRDVHTGSVFLHSNNNGQSEQSID